MDWLLYRSSEWVAFFISPCVIKNGCKINKLIVFSGKQKYSYKCMKMLSVIKKGCKINKLIVFSRKQKYSYKYMKMLIGFFMGV